MIQLTRSKFGFKIKEIWFADVPFDVEGADVFYFHACKTKVDLPGFHITESNTLTIDLTQGLETIWQNMSKSSCRYAINKAIKDTTIISGIDIDYKPFWELNKTVRSKKNYPPMKNTFLPLKEHCKLFVAFRNNELVAGQLYLLDDNIMRLTINASDGSNANRLLMWCAMNNAKAEGLKTFDFGGYDPEHYPGVSAFKKSFGGAETRYYNYKKVYSNLLRACYRRCCKTTGVSPLQYSAFSTIW